MKEFKKTTTYIFFVLLTLYACTKEVEVQFSFDFNLNETYDDIATINYQEPVLIKIVPLKVIEGNTYKFSYQINSGSGYLINELGAHLEANTIYTAETLDVNLDFIGTELGEVTLTVTVTDQDSRIKSTTLVFEVIHNPFIWDANSTISNVTLNETTPLSLILDNTGEDTSVTYESKFYFAQGEGTIYKTDTNGASTTEVEQNEFIPISENIHSYNIDFTQTGTNKVYFEAKDSNGQTKIDSLIYTVNEIDFQYIGATQQNTLFIGGLTNLNFEINEIGGSGEVYESRLEFNSGNAVIKRTYNGVEESINPGVYYPVNVGSYIWEIEATALGTIDMTYYAKNSTGTEQPINIIIEVSTGSFEFQAYAAENIASVNDEVLINFDINENGPSGSPYNIFFESTNNGVLLYNGVTYNAGEQFTVTDLNFTASYQGLSGGNHDIVFYAENTLNETILDNATILFNEDTFSFTADSDLDNVVLGNTTDFNFNINDNNTGATYQMLYTISGSGSGMLTSGSTTFSSGTSYNVINGNFDWEFLSQTIGDLTYSFTVTNNSGFEQTQTLSLNVVNTPPSDFTFSAIASQNTTQTNVPVTINYNIVETTGTGSPYQMVYTTSIAGTISYNGTVYAQGEIIPIVAGASVGVFTPLEAGEANIEFTATNNDAISRNDDVNITVNTTIIDFSLSTVGDGDLYINTLKDFFTIITQDQTDASITYQVRFNMVSGSTGSGELYKDGNLINLGIYQPTDIGNTNYQFKGTLLGNVSVLVEVLGSNGTNQSSILDFTIDSISYSFSATEQDGSITLGESTDVFFNISETANSGANYDIKYIITSSETGEFVNAGTIIDPNTPTPISVGASSWTFNSVETGTITITFIAKNLTTLEEKDDSINIIVEPQTIPDFSFTAIPVSNSNAVGECIEVNFDITEFVAPSAPYKMVFTTSLAGTFEFNGTVYQQGELIDLSSLGNATTFNGCYTGTTSGSHNIEFTLTNNNIPSISHSEPVDIGFNDNDFDFNVTSTSSEEVVGNTVGQNFTYTEDTTFTQNLSFTTSGIGTFIYNGNSYAPNDLIPISLSDLSNGSWFGGYIGNSSGVHNITYTLTANNDVSKTRNVTIIYTSNCAISTTDFGEWINPISGNNVNDTYTWDNENFTQEITSDFTFSMSTSCNEIVKLSYSIISENGVIPDVEVGYNSSLSSTPTSIGTNSLIHLSPSLTHTITIGSIGNSNIGSRVLKFVLSNGVDTKEVIFTQQYN